MADREQLAILKQGVEDWNDWREEHKDQPINLIHAHLEKARLTWVNLSKANLSGAVLTKANLHRAKLYYADFTQANLSHANLIIADLVGAKLQGADLRGADLSSADLTAADLRGANLSGAELNSADLTDADLRGANLGEADLTSADLTGADFSGANLDGANLEKTVMMRTDLTNANLANCNIYGISVWNVKLEGAIQSNLSISDWNEPVITVDNLEIAQFVYLLVHNEKLRDVIDTVGRKAVLILGRFTEERKPVLEAIREELRKRDYIPILFDFEKPSSRDLTETVVTLAHMARFVIADLTDPRSIPHEMMSFVPGLPSVAVQPIILQTDRPYAMFEHLQRYPWVLPIHEYESQEQLIAQLPEKVIEPAEAKVIELRPAAK